MRFIYTVLYMIALYKIFNFVLHAAPVCFMNFLVSAGSSIICIYLSIWIIEFTQDYIFTSEISAKGKAVLITGCDSGFGHIVAKDLDKKGFKVFAGCLDPNSKGACNLKETCSSRLHVISLDVTDNGSVQRALDTVVNNVNDSVLWAVVNNAGVLRSFLIEMTQMKDFETSMQVNALGPVRVTKAFLPLLRKSKGRVVNICSIAGRFSTMFVASYNMSKFAEVAFTEVLMQEAKEFGIRVISVEPDVYSTALTSKECLSNVIDSVTMDVEPEIIDAYGARYIGKVKEYYTKFFSMSSPRICRVTESVEKAVCLQYPADIYKPRANLFTNFLYFLACRIPTKLFDLPCAAILYLLNTPRTKLGLSFGEKILNM